MPAGAPGSIKFKLWEGSIEDPVSDNRFIGMFEIKGMDFTEGMISKGAELHCEYEVLDSGNIILEVTVPSIGNAFSSGRNFYSRQEGQIDYTKAIERLAEERARIDARIDEIAGKIDDPRLEQARDRLKRSMIEKGFEGDPETAKQAMDDIQEAKKLLALVRKENRKIIRQMELEKSVEHFDLQVRHLARPAELVACENLINAAKRAIENNRGDFDSYLRELSGKFFVIHWRQDWFVIDRFKWLAASVFMFTNVIEHEKLSQLGRKALQANDIDQLRQVVMRLDSIRVVVSGGDDIIAASNIVIS